MMLRATLVIVLATTSSAFGQHDRPIDFAHEVLPLIRDRCGSCHTNGKSKGDLSMDTREDLLKAGAIVPGKAGDSPFIERVVSQDPEERMPPKGPPLSDAQVSILRRWIDQGARWEVGFSFAKAGAGLPMKPRTPELPLARDGRDHPVDRVVDHDFTAMGISPKAGFDIEQRPFYVTEDGKGKAVADLFA